MRQREDNRQALNAQYRIVSVMIRIGINGFGRIGRAFFRLAHEHAEMEVAAINDLADPATLAYLLCYDTVYGTYGHDVRAEKDALVVDATTRIPLFSVRTPADIPWREAGVEVVVEATGMFTSYEKANTHKEGGAARVVVTAPVADAPEDAKVKGATVLVGANEKAFAATALTSNASCTTNAANPLVGILGGTVGIEKALLNTVHAYTSTQSLVDGPAGKDMRRGRAASVNIIPSSTGAAISTTKAHPSLAGVFDGIALRVPVMAGSIVDVTFLASRATSAEEINHLLTEAAASVPWKHLFAVTDRPIVSSDIIGARYAAIADLSLTRVVGGNLVKVLAWYDNEIGYAHTLVEHILKAGRSEEKEVGSL